jgi:WD40 repeat protein
LILWDLAGDRRLARSFSLRREFEDIQTPRGIAVSPDGEHSRLPRGGGAVDLIDTATLQKRGSVQAAPDYAAAVAFSPDGRLLAVSGGSGSVTLWDAETLRPAGRLKGLSGELQTIAFSPDGESLAAAEVIPNPAHLVVWDVRRRAVTVEVDTGNITSLAFSPDGRLIALSALDGGTEIRNAQSGKLVKRIPEEGLARSVASPDGSLFAVGTFDNDGQLYSIPTWKPLGRRLEGHSDRITNVEFSRDGRTLAASSGDGTVLLWDVKTQERIGSPLPVEPGTLVSVALHPDGSHLFAVSTELVASASRSIPKFGSATRA